MPTLRTYWKSHYVTEVEPHEIEGAITLANFTSGGASHELVCFLSGKDRPNLLVSQGSGGHAYVFAELAYLMHLEGYNVFIMPKHGGHTVPELIRRHLDALAYIARGYGERTGAFAEGLGGFVAFYLALAGGPTKSIALQNAPAILTEMKWRRAISGGAGGGRREKFLPILRSVSRLLPGLKVPLRLYLDFGQLMDTHEESRTLEERLVNDGYKNDPDFDRWYPLRAVMSLVTAPPPRPLSAAATPTLFMVARRGFIPPAYFEDLYDRLPPIKKEMVEVDGSVYWMLSHPREAARMICGWFDQTMGAHVEAARTAAGARSHVLRPTKRAPRLEVALRDPRGQNALVTGASGGLGRHPATALAATGVNVAISGERLAARLGVANASRTVTQRHGRLAGEVGRLAGDQQRPKEPRVTFEMVLRELRKRDFPVLSTADDEGRPHPVGVEYGVSPQGTDIYVMTRRQLKEVRDIAANPRVSLAVPLTRRLLWFLPPACIQFQGTPLELPLFLRLQQGVPGSVRTAAYTRWGSRAFGHSGGGAQASSQGWLSALVQFAQYSSARSVSNDLERPVTRWSLTGLRGPGHAHPQLCFRCRRRDGLRSGPRGL